MSTDAPCMFSIARSEFFTPSKAATSDDGCISKDVLLEVETGLQVRLFLPAPSTQHQQPRFPVIVYVHGGAFCMLRSSTACVHDFCVQLAKTAQAVVVSIDYRLAPEHRLPAAYEDCSKVLGWLSSHSDEQIAVPEPWIASYADVSHCFLMGEGSGANILHHLLLSGVDKLLKTRASILIHPFFGGGRRTSSEAELASQDAVLPADLFDEFWSYCLPVGADRDHRFCKPFSQDQLVSLRELQLPRLLVVVGGRSSLQDRQVDYFNQLKQSGKDVLLLYLVNAGHNFEFVPAQSDQASILLEVVLDFMAGETGGMLSRSASLVRPTKLQSVGKE